MIQSRIRPDSVANRCNRHSMTELLRYIIIISTETLPSNAGNELFSTMPLITRSSSMSSSDGGGDNPSAVTARSLFRRSDSAAVLPDESLDQRDVFTFTSDNEELIGSSSSTTPRCSNKSSRAIISSSEEAAAEMMLASNNKRRKISDDASSSRDDPSFSTNNISHPGPNDVMYGRGGATNAHIGNKKFRCIVESLKSKYLHAPRNEKSEIAMDAVALWRRFDPPGRFLKQNEQEQSSCGEEEIDDANGGTWYDVGNDEARKKTSQMLRDAANPSAANYVKLFGRYEAELLQVCIEYLQGKSPGSGEVVDPLVLLSQMKTRKKMKQQKIPSSGVSSHRALQQFRLTSTATSSYPTQSLRGVSKPSPGSIVHQLPSELEPQHLHMSIPSNLEENPPKKQQSLTPKVVGEIFASLDSNKGCKHDFCIILLPEIEKTIMPPFLQYSGTLFHAKGKCICCLLSFALSFMFICSLQKEHIYFFVLMWSSLPFYLIGNSQNMSYPPACVSVRGR